MLELAEDEQQVLSRTAKKGSWAFEGLKTTDVYAGIGRSGRRKVVVDGAF